MRDASEAPAWAQVGASFDFVTARDGNAVGFLFADPLVAPPLEAGPNNKILWVVREPRLGQDLQIEAQLDGDVVTTTELADSFPGEIYPSIVDVPRPGCWHITLRWGPNTAELNLNYQPS